MQLELEFADARSEHVLLLDGERLGLYVEEVTHTLGLLHLCE